MELRKIGSANATACCVLFASWNGLSYTDFGNGRPVTAKDLSGKHFCWGNGTRTLYGADGMLSNSRGAHNKPWSIANPGLFLVGRNGRVQMEVLTDGRLHTYKYCLECG